MKEMTENRPGRLRSWSTRLLDGESRWGFVHIQIDRFGVTRYRLVVYPPGISDDERRRLRIWRGAPVWGAPLWFVAEVFLQQVTGPVSALAISTGTVTALVAFALVRADGMRTRVRAIGVVTMAGLKDEGTVAARDDLLAKAMMLTCADERVDEERMSPLDHEALWWQIYEQIAPAGSAASGRRMPQQHRASG
jgi:hypothetical protein